MSFKLFVSGFPLDIQEIELAKLIAPHGDIETLKIVRDKKTQVCKGYAFVEMKNEQGAHTVEEALNGQKISGKTITVKVNEEPETLDSGNVEIENVRPPVYQKLSKPKEDLRKKRPRRAI